MGVATPNVKCGSWRKVVRKRSVIKWSGNNGATDSKLVEVRRWEGEPWKVFVLDASYFLVERLWQNILCHMQGTCLININLTIFTCVVQVTGRRGEDIIPLTVARAVSAFSSGRGLKECQSVIRRVMTCPALHCVNADGLISQWNREMGRI